MHLRTYVRHPWAQQNLAEREDALIGRGRRPAASGRSYFATLDPATEQTLAQVAEGESADVNAAVAAARTALEGEWGHARPAERGHALLRLADLVRQHQEELIALESHDSGKPVSAIRRQDLPAVLDTLTYYAGWADKIHGQVIPARPDALTYTVREPIGVVGAIVPWNFPLMISMWKVAPALACGCTVVLKPAELTPLTALRMGELALQAGFPSGVLNVVPGYGRTAGAALAEHPDVDKVTFTGSPAVGRQILRSAAGNLKRVTLELGGKSANIVFPDADLARPPRPRAGIFFHSGQCCSAGSRILVHRDIHDEFVERLVARARALRIGDPRDAGTAMGPLVWAGQTQRVLDYVEVHTRAPLPPPPADARWPLGHSRQTAIHRRRHDMRISQGRGLPPGGLSDPLGRPRRRPARRRISSTIGWRRVSGSAGSAIGLPAAQGWDRGVNTFGPTDVRLPWGGARESGFGRRARRALENFTEPKAVWINTRA